MVGYRPPRPKGAPTDWRPQKIQYRLKHTNGGKDPFAEHPADWAFGLRTPTCDCVGFVVWCLGFDRYQRDLFPHWGGWVNTDSMLISARAGDGWFEEIETPELACLVVRPSTYLEGERDQPGHVGIVTGLPAEWDRRYPSWDMLRVTHCAGSNEKIALGAIEETHAKQWHGRGRLLRYLGEWGVLH
jgi:hypothetical protein